MHSVSPPQGPDASEVEVDAEPQVLDRLPEELSFEGVSGEILQQQLQVPAEHAHALELDPGPEREVRLPVVLLPELKIQARDGAHPAVPQGPRAPPLDAGLSRSATEVGRVHIDQVPTAAVRADAQG